MGDQFKAAPNTNRNAETRNIRTSSQAHDTCNRRPDVDSKRIGIWGLSYGGLLTAQALARNSDIFAAGVDLAGVHLYGNSLDPAELSYQSSAISQIDKWKSPVLLIHGDDDPAMCRFNSPSGCSAAPAATRCLLRTHRFPRRCARVFAV